MDSLITQLKTLQAKVADLTQRLKLDQRIQRLAELETQAGQPELWNEPEIAQGVMKDLSRVREEVERWQKLTGQVDDALELAELEDDTLLDDLGTEVTRVQEHTDKMELEVVFSNPYDREDAIISIHAGAGGTDAQDWAQMLERMYFRWAERNGHSIEIIDRSEGESAGIKSVTASIRGGSYPYGYLQSEQGVHRLVRISPFNSSGTRETSFAKIELWPDIQGDIAIEINPNDLRIDTYRAGGAGGQNVQKNDTAVRITHIPTGLVVQCQNQRSQAQNRERALQILKSRLLEMELRRQEQTISDLKGDNVNAEWGHQIRNYVLHPYRLVKDVRTSYEVGNVDGVLDGDLNDFMEAYLRLQLHERNETNA